MKPILLAISLLLASLASAQDVKQTRTIEGIQRIRINSGVQAFVKVGETEALNIEATGIEESQLQVEQKGDELVIGINWTQWRPRQSKTRTEVKAYLTVRQLRAVVANAGANVQGETPFVAEKFEVSSQAGATVSLELKTRDVDVRTNSGASVTLTGTAQAMNVSAGSGATVNATDLTADVVDADAGSGASIRVNAQKELFGKASMGGSVSNRGPGRTVSKRTSLGGSVN
jgi:hypothetical protein